MGGLIGVVFGGLVAAGTFVTVTAVTAAASETVRTMVRERVRKTPLCLGK